MESADLCYAPATELAAGYRARRFLPSEVVSAVLDRIQALNPLVNAFCTVVADSALADARAADEALQHGELRGPLHGVPISIKDVIPTKGVLTTYGSKVFERFVPDTDAPVAERLKVAGAVLLGKTNTPEFGWKSPTDNRLFGPTRNPWNLERTAAGSSGGAAAAVATGMGPLAVGSDGGGSIRQPASFCGVFGFKPSFGLVPNHPPGVIDTFVSIGPLTRTVRDAGLLLNAIAGPDDRDWFSVPGDQVDHVAACDGGQRGLRVAWSPDLGYAVVDPQVRRVTELAALRFAELGCEVVEDSPGWDDPADLFHVLFWGLMGAMVEDLSPDSRHLLDPGLLDLADMGRSISAFDVARAIQARGELQQRARRFFERYDLLLTPTMSLPPFGLGISIPSAVADQEVHGMQWTPFTFPFNLTGQPAASVPCGWTADGLPIGLQVIGNRRADATVLRACAAFELAFPWTGRRPDLDPLLA